MKNIFVQYAVLASVALLVTACQTSTASDSTATSQPGSKDIAACEQNTRAFLASDYTGDNSVPVQYMTREFARLWLWACNPPPGNTNYWGADPILETQDMEPTLTSFGPGFAKAATIRVPVVYQHQGQQPFTKTFVLTKANGKWRISDIITSGLNASNESEVAKISKDYGKLW
jgi:hypothetical protein